MGIRKYQINTEKGDWISSQFGHGKLHSIYIKTFYDLGSLLY